MVIRNGSTADSQLIGKFCGQTLPNPIFPQSNQLYLRFKSDFSTARDGFDATWTSSPHGCGGILYGDHGSFSSPNYPGSYPNNTHCEWSIKAPRGHVVTITFALFSIDDPGNCQNNFLKLYDGPDTSSAPVGPYCGVLCVSLVLANPADGRAGCGDLVLEWLQMADEDEVDLQ
ncbi:cubilin-like [Poecilia reticulata]|uniref:cubilin-like n=1 Tax=Poecilia reticulata TaxID=8081 RepID=UPI0007EA5339|nr:PREDICTED: cubilin-like [Poecilia reticulata]